VTPTAAPTNTALALINGQDNAVLSFDRLTKNGKTVTKSYRDIGQLLVGQKAHREATALAHWQAQLGNNNYNPINRILELFPESIQTGIQRDAQHFRASSKDSAIALSSAIIRAHAALALKGKGKALTPYATMLQTWLTEVNPPLTVDAE
jgi:hypothetical protein